MRIVWNHSPSRQVDYTNAMSTGVEYQFRIAAPAVGPIGNQSASGANDNVTSGTTHLLPQTLPQHVGPAQMII